MMGVVEQKFAPKLGQKFFFVRLANVRDHLWFAAAHFSKFEPMDAIRVVHFRESVGKVWVRPEDKVEVTERAQVSTREVSLKLGYVSNPREVFKDEYWYMFKLQHGIVAATSSPSAIGLAMSGRMGCGQRITMPFSVYSGKLR